MTNLAPGTVIRDTYTVVSFLGAGAFGKVYLARHRYMGLQALKVFPVRDHGDALEEAFVLTRLGHPNVVRVFEANTFFHAEQELGYFSMEFAEDGMLSSWLSEDRTLAQRLSLLPQLASALACAHSQAPPIVHRDIKPSNVLVKKATGGFEAKLSDFGLAKAIDLHTKLASAAGTYFYMAPEVFELGETPASDIYSLGLTFYEVLTGKHPFQVRVPAEANASTMVALVRSVRQQFIEPPQNIDSEIPATTSRIVMQMLAYDHHDRIQDGVELNQRFSGTGTKNDALSTKDLVAAALGKAQQQSTLDEAVALLKEAIRRDPSLDKEYGPLLNLWRKGIVQ